MIKDLLKKRLIILLMSLIIFILTILFPTNHTKTITSVSYNDNTWPLYISNKDNIASLIKVISNETTTISKAKEIISYLTINANNTNYLPEYFIPILPSNTKIIDIKNEDNILTINFSKEFNNINKEYSRLAIECLVYSLLEIKDIKGIIIYVDNTLLSTIPNTNELLSYPLTRTIGINIKNNINSIKNVVKTTSYYKSTYKNYSYSIPVTTIKNSNKNKIEIVIEELKSNPHIKTNLISYLNASRELTKYELLEDEIKLSFNNLSDEIITEETTYAISLSMRDTLNISKVEITKPLE